MRAVLEEPHAAPGAECRDRFDLRADETTDMDHDHAARLWSDRLIDLCRAWRSCHHINVDQHRHSAGGEHSGVSGQERVRGNQHFSPGDIQGAHRHFQRAAPAA